MHKCIVPGCTHTIEENRQCGVSFHRLPGDVALRERWKDAIGMDLPPASLVCSTHFKVECILPKTGKVVLAPGSVPTEHLNERRQGDHLYAR